MEKLAKIAAERMFEKLALSPKVYTGAIKKRIHKLKNLANSGDEEKFRALSDRTSKQIKNMSNRQIEIAEKMQRDNNKRRTALQSIADNLKTKYN